MDTLNDDHRAIACRFFSGPVVDVSEPPWEYLYVKIANHLVAAIRSGRLQCGEKLPPKKVLVSIYGVSGSTMTRALKLVETHGWIVISPGRGTYIALTIEAVKAVSSDPIPARPALAGKQG
jgi:DNA-binding FadR family transcriptional regulator